MLFLEYLTTSRLHGRYSDLRTSTWFFKTGNGLIESKATRYLYVGNVEMLFHAIQSTVRPQTLWTR